MFARHARILLPQVLAVSSLLLVACQPDVEQPNEPLASYVLQGQILDEQGQPVAGARVSADGVEAEALTDAAGNYRIESPFGFESQVQLAVSASGKEPLTALLRSERNTQDRSISQVSAQQLKSSAGPQYMEVTAPLPGSEWALDTSCRRTLEVEGVVSYVERSNVRTDLLILIDRSGSTSRAFDPNDPTSLTIFELELQAAERLVDALNSSVTRVSVLAFATEAGTATSFSNDYAGVKAALARLREEGPEVIGTSTAATHYQAGMDAARQAFLNTPLVLQDSNTNGETELETLKALVFLSDGIPTLPVAPGTSQEKGDVQASLTAADGLAAASIQAFTFAVGMPQATSRLTTLHSIATITGGSYSVLEDPSLVVEGVPEESLVHMGQVLVENELLGVSEAGMTSPDGFFSIPIPIVAGSQRLWVSALDAEGLGAITREVWVKGVSLPDYSQPQGLASQSVAQRGVYTPTNKAPGDKDLYECLISQEKDFPDAVESLGTELWGIPGSSGSVTLKGEYTFREACWNSDIGYLIVDPTRLEASTKEALKAATSSNLMFNTGTASTSCSQQYLTSGMKGTSFSITVPQGQAVVFFLVQNGKLADAQKGYAEVIYTVSSLNPGGYDQVLSYYSQKGRQGKGSKPQAVLAWEDTSLSCGADQDFDDVIFYLEGIVPAARQAACPDQDGDNR
ncbi:MAG: carboxypeptidase regulatory-like domain-containing protein [Myxococcota bacterium]